MSELGVTNFYQALPEKSLCLCLFNRATYSRVKSLIMALEKHKNIKLTLVLSSSLCWSEYGNAETYIRKAHPGVTVYPLALPKEPATHGYVGFLAGSILSHLSTYFEHHRYDAVLVVGDRFETLPAAYAANVNNIPVVHIQGGEVTGNIDDRTRHALTKLADYHFVATELAKEYVIEMGEDSKRVWNKGCPSLDLICKAHIQRHRAKEKYIFCIFHPETESSSDALAQTKVVFSAVLEYCMRNKTKCYWYYPNPDPGREEIIQFLNELVNEYLPTSDKDFLKYLQGAKELDSKYYIVKAVNEEPEEFLRRMSGAQFIIGNSSVGLREASFLGVPSINVGDRQRIRERGHHVQDVGFDKERLLEAMLKAKEMYRYSKSQLYGSGRAGEYIAEYLARIDYELKGTLTYPDTIKYREKHFGEGRFDLQKKERSKPTFKVKSTAEA